MQDYRLKPIGKVENDEKGVFIKLAPEYIPGLLALDGFSHINVIWWFSDCDNQTGRDILQTEQPYKGAPPVMGVFATRSPFRPNPIALTVVEIIHMDFEQGIIQVSFIDAKNDTPILDMKPYTPSLDRVEAPDVPMWCSDWPKSIEQSGYFDWEQVFNFE